MSKLKQISRYSYCLKFSHSWFKGRKNNGERYFDSQFTENSTRNTLYKLQYKNNTKYCYACDKMCRIEY